MHPSIRSFPSLQFYESMLEDQVSIPASAAAELHLATEEGAGMVVNVLDS